MKYVVVFFINIPRFTAFFKYRRCMYVCRYVEYKIDNINILDFSCIVAKLRASKMQNPNMSLIGLIIASNNNQARENYRFVCINAESFTFLLVNFIFVFPYLRFKVIFLSWRFWLFNRLSYIDVKCGKINVTLNCYIKYDWLEIFLEPIQFCVTSALRIWRHYEKGPICAIGNFVVEKKNTCFDLLWATVPKCESSHLNHTLTEAQHFQRVLLLPLRPHGCS